MARTQAADYEERREAIVEKAAFLFAQYGFLGTSVSQIAKACGASKSLLYHYYPSKEDVLYAVMASHVDQLVDVVEEEFCRTTTPSQRLHTLLVRFMEEYVHAASRQKVLLNELAHLPPDRRNAIVVKQRGIVDAIQGLVIVIRPDLAIDRTAARALTMLIFGMINWTGNWFDPEGRLSPREIAEMAFGLISRDVDPKRPNSLSAQV